MPNRPGPSRLNHSSPASQKPRPRLPQLVALERRQMLASLPFHLDFNSATAGSIADKDGQGTGFPGIQPNTAGNQHQPSLIDLDTAAGVLRMTTNGTSAAGGNARADNTLVNALRVDFDGTGQVFEIRTKLVGGLGAISDGYEQGGLMFGPDQDNWIKLVAIWHVGDGGSRLEFTDEYSDGSGGTTSTVTNGRVFVASWSEVSTLDLRLIANPTTGVVTAWYKINGAATWSQVPHSITVPTDKRAAFFSTAAQAGIIQFDKSDSQNVTIVYDSFDIERQAPATGPSVRAMRPAPGETNVRRDSFVAVDLNLPNGALDPSTVNSGSVYLVNNATGQVIAATVNTTGGGDAITLTPAGLLAANTSYTFHITSGVKDVGGASFQQFSGSFTTGTSVAESDPRIAFNRTIQAATVGIGWTGAAIGPDGKLYGVTDKGEIHRFDIAADGSLTNRALLFSFETATGTRRLITGLAFDTSQGTLTAYVSHGQYVDPGNDADRTAADWSGVITRFTGANLESRQDVIVGLPRSVYDHLNNQPVFGPDGRLYFVMASNTAMGAADSTWGNRPERLLSGAVLAADVRSIGGTAVNVKTQDGGTYDPFATGAPVKIYATGIRNGWDLVWTSGGRLFVPANGSAAGGNTPAGPGSNPPAINGVSETQNDFLFRIVEGGYYGHPNPLRGEYVLNGGNPTAAADPAEVSQYPVGTTPPAHYKGFAFDFGRNVSPNGILEYNSGGAHFSGALDGKLLVVRYSGGDDILILDIAADGTVNKSYGGSFGMTGLTDPLDIVQDPATGNIYVVEAGFRTDGGNPAGLRISLLKPIAATNVSVGSPRMINYGGGNTLHFSDVFGNAQAGLPHRITITNTGSGPLALPADAFSITGSAAARFSLSGVPTLPSTLAAGQSLAVDVLFTATAKGVVSAELTIKTNDFSQPTRTIGLRGLGTVGEGGSNEPSLQRILDLYQLPIAVGDPNAETTDYPSQTSVSGSQEVAMQVLRKAGTGPVRIELLASMGTANANAFTDTSSLGWYNISSGAKTEVLRIAKTYAQTANVTHSGSLSFDPGAGDFGLVGTFFDFGPRDVWSEDARNTWETTAGERRKVRFFPLKDANGATVANAYIFAFEEFESATDQNDTVGIIYNVQPAGSAANAQLANVDQIPFHDRLIFSRIRDLEPTFPNLVHDIGRLTITNSGGQTLTVSSITLSNAEFQITGGGTGGGAISLAPGASHTVTVKFVYNDSTARGSRVRSGTLTILSNDPDAPTQTVELRGLWQSDSEAGDNAKSQEPNLFELVQVLGYTIDVGPNLGRDDQTGTNTGGRVERIGSETLSASWRKADAGKPVELLQIGAWHRQTATNNTRTRWYLQGNHLSPTFLFQHDAEYSQSFLPPLNNSTLPSRAGFDPGGNAFGIMIDGHFTDPALNANEIDDGHAMRWYALRDRQGARIPDAWLVAHDYAGSTIANYDYQDNTYIIFNARPVAGPTAPTGLTATGASGGNALSWTRNTEGNLGGYNIYASDSPTGTFAKLNTSLITGGSTVTFTHASAPVGLARYYRVVPVDEHGTEGAFSAASATRPSGSTVPSAPGALAASSIEHNRVILGWVDNSGNETGFRIERALGNGAFGSIGTVAAGQTSFTDNTVSAETTYRYRVFAFNAEGDSAASNIVTVNTPSDPSQIAAPTNLRLTALEAYRVSLAWDDNSSNETGFRIERAVGSGSFALLATIQAANTTSYADATAQPRTDYRYRVVAINSVAASSPSNVLSATTPGDPTQIASPTGLVASAPVATQVNLEWTDNADNENAFVIERRLAASSAWEQIATVGQDAQNYIDTAVSADTSYVYRVFARNALAQSSYSNEATVTTPQTDGYLSDNIGDAGGSTAIVRPGQDHDVIATGGGMGGTADNLRFVHRLIVGDFDYRVRVASLDKADPASAAGLMVRETTAAGARNLFLRTSGEVRLSYRDTANSGTAGAGLVNPGVPVWLRLVRSGDVFTAFYSGGGSSWTQLAQVTVSMPIALRLGLAVSSYSTNPTTVQFRDLGIVQDQAPAAPAGLAASVQGSQSVALQWTDAADNETGYRVQRRDAGASAWQTLATLADGTSAYVDSTVAPGGGYEYRVLAFNNTGESASGIVSADVPDAQPNPPINVTGAASRARGRGATLSWTGDDNVSSYRIERRTGASGEWQTLTSISGAVRSLRDASAEPGQVYQYRIIAVGATGESAPSATVMVGTAPAGKLERPTVVVEALGERVARLRWNDLSEGENGFRVQRRLPGSQWIDHALVFPESSAFTDRGLAAGVSYEYRVRSEGDGHVGAWSAPVLIEMPFATEWQHVRIGGAASGSTDIRPGTHYDVVAGGRDVWGTADEQGFVYRHISGDFDYAVRITALDGADAGRMAGLMARSGIDAASRNVFVKLREDGVILTSRSSDGGQTLSNASLASTGVNRWLRLARRGGTLIAWTGTDGSTWTEVGRVSVNLGTDVLMGLATSARSETASVTARYRDLTNLRAKVELPAPPLGLQATAADGLVELAWSDASGGRVGFQVQRRTIGGLWQTLGFVGEGSTHFTDTSAETDVLYQYRVAGESVAGVGAFGAEVTVQG